MSDESKTAVGFQGAGGVAPAASGAASGTEPQGTQAQQPKYVTFEEAQRLAAEAAEKALRGAQSLTDKSESRIKKEIADRMKAIQDAAGYLRDAGVEITPEVEGRIRQAVVMESLTKADQPGEKVAAPPAPATVPEPDVVTADAHRLMRQAGVWIEEGDPEAAMLNHSSHYAFLHSIEQAIAKKAARLQQQRPAAATPARTPTSAGQAGSAPSLMQQYQNEISRPGLNMDQRLAIRQKYRKAGLPL